MTVLCDPLGGRYSLQPDLRSSQEIEDKARLVLSNRSSTLRKGISLEPLLTAETDLRRMLSCEESTEEQNARLELENKFS